ncbi:MAG: polymer-forming cytoskeletal protein [Thermoanaerobaculia bacterium]
MATSSVIAAGTELCGRLTVASDLRFEGRLIGELSVRGDLIVAASAGIEGPLQARSATIAGAVRGPVCGLQRVEICCGGSVVGDVTAPCIVLAEGSELDGRIEIPIE